MARQPRVVSDIAPQFAGRSLGAAQAPGLALANFGETVTQVGGVINRYLEKQKQVQDFNDFNARKNEATLKIDAVISAHESNPDFRTNEQRVTKDVQTIIADSTKGTNSEVKARLDSVLGDMGVKAQINARSYSRAKETEYGRAQFMMAQEQLLQKAAVADGADLEGIKGEFIDLLNESEDAMLIGPEDRVKFGQAWLEKLDRSRDRQEMVYNPEAVLNKLLKGEGNYDPEDRANRIIEAQNRILFIDNQRKNKENDERAAEVRAQSDLNDTFIARAVAGENVTGQLLQSADALGPLFQKTLSDVRVISEAVATGDFLPPDGSTTLDFDSRMYSPTNPLRRGEVLAAAGAHKIGGRLMKGYLAAIYGRDQSRSDNPAPQGESAAITDAQRSIYQLANVKQVGMGGPTMTILDNQRQTEANQRGQIELMTLIESSKAAGKRLTALQIMEQGVLIGRKWQGLLMPEVEEMNETGKLFGKEFVEDAEQEIARSQYSEQDAAILLRIAEMRLMHKPKPAAQKKQKQVPVFIE